MHAKLYGTRSHENDFETNDGHPDRRRPQCDKRKRTCGYEDTDRFKMEICEASEGGCREGIHYLPCLPTYVQGNVGAHSASLDHQLFLNHGIVICSLSAFSWTVLFYLHVCCSASLFPPSDRHSFIVDSGACPPQQTLSAASTNKHSPSFSDLRPSTTSSSIYTNAAISSLDPRSFKLPRQDQHYGPKALPIFSLVFMSTAE